MVSGTGAGVLAMSNILNYFVRRHGWRLGLQAVTLILLSMFFIGDFTLKIWRPSIHCSWQECSTDLPPSTILRGEPFSISRTRPGRSNVRRRKKRRLISNIVVQLLSLNYNLTIDSEEKSPVVDFSCFKSYTFRVLTVSNIFAFTGKRNIFETQIQSILASRKKLNIYR